MARNLASLPGRWPWNESIPNASQTITTGMQECAANMRDNGANAQRVPYLRSRGASPAQTTELPHAAVHSRRSMRKVPNRLGALHVLRCETYP
jgi:hypothetical protein